MGINSITPEINQSYDHQAWALKRRFCRLLLRMIGFSLFAKIDKVEGRENIPPEGPVITLINHLAFIDPIAVLYVAPREIVPLAKTEVYDYPFVGIFPRLWGVVPIKRDEIDRAAIRGALGVLRAGECLLVAPEGTRGPALKRGKEGAAYLASRSGAAIVPVAIEGTDGFPAFRPSQRWKGPGAHIRFGRPFRYKPEFNHAKGEMLSKMSDEAMYVLAKMLPEHRRGVYADIENSTQDTIEWM